MQQLDLLAGPPPGDGPQTIERDGLRLRYWPGWLTDASILEQTLQQQVPWRQQQITLWNRTHPLPRLTCWVGDPGCTYTYSGVRNSIAPWSPVLAELRDRLEDLLGVRFNSLLLNLYRDGRDKLDWHADDEPELVPDAPIASLSLGSPRTFRLRPRKGSRPSEESLSYELGAGDLLVMDPPTQRYWLHQVPSRLKVRRPRINLTFRLIRPEAMGHV